MRGNLIERLDQNNRRMDRLYDAMARREDYGRLEKRVMSVEDDLAEIIRKVA